MSRQNNRHKSRQIIRSIVSVGVAVVIAEVTIGTAAVRAQCPAVPTDTGKVTVTTNFDSAGTYNVWSRVIVPDTTNNSYYLQLDTGCAVLVGDTDMPTNTLTWVQHQDGSTANKTVMDISAGSHTFTLTGREANVGVDTLMFIQDSCVPVDTGSNCTIEPVDTVSPTVSVTEPAEGSTVSGTVTVKVNASDNVGVTKVDLYHDGILSQTDNTAPYEFPWNTTSISNAAHSLEARAYDAAGNFGTSSVSVTVNNPVLPPPPPPPAPVTDTTAPVVTITSPANNSTVAGNVTISARATDDVSVKTIAVYVDGKQLSLVNGDTVSVVWNSKSGGKTASKIRNIEVRATDPTGNIGRTNILVQVK